MKCLSFIEIEKIIQDKKTPYVKRFLFNQHLKKCDECHGKYLEVTETIEFEQKMNRLIDED